VPSPSMAAPGDQNIATALWQLSAQNDIDMGSGRGEREALGRELKVSRREVHALRRELQATRHQLRERKEYGAALARQLQDHHAEIDYLRTCEEEWLRDLERQAMRPVIGIEVQELANPDRTVRLTVSSLAQKGTASKAGLQTGDVIIRFGKTEVASKRAFAEALLAAPIGSKQPLHVIRHGVTAGGKPCTSVESLHVLIAGAAPTGFTLDLLRDCDDPEDLVQQCKKDGVRALAAYEEAWRQ
jgi:C-terminal processing protease CtpA/Prc